MILHIKEEWIKPIVNIVFFIILFALTAYGLIHITDNKIIKIIIPFAAFILDLYMLFILSKAKFLWKNNLKMFNLQGINIDINKLKAIGYFFIYAIYTFIYVFLVAVGFYLSEFNAAEEKIKIQEEINQINIAEIKINQAKSQALVKGLDLEVKTKYGNKSKKLDEDISNLSQTNNKLKNELVASLKNVKQTSKNFIMSLSEQFGWNEKSLKALFFGLFVLLMQFSLISSSFDIEIDNSSKIKKSNDNNKELLSWLDAAFDGRLGSALNGVNTISQKTGMPVEKCLQYRKHLSELNIDEKMAITVDQGGTRANYPKEFIRDYILNH